MTNTLTSKPLLSCTVAEFIEAMKTSMGVADMEGSEGTSPEITPTPHLCTGIKALAQFLNCHYNTAQKIYASGALDAAVYRHGKLIIFNTDLVLDLLKVQKKKVGTYKFQKK